MWCKELYLKSWENGDKRWQDTVCDIFAPVMMKHLSVVWLARCVLWMEMIYFIQAELFTAVVDLERILHAEYEVAKDLRNYVENEQRRIDTLKR